MIKTESNEVVKEKCYYKRRK